MKGRSKTQKGITLIALIITIIVLLILAVVTIAAIQNDGIISHAQNAANTYNESQGQEENTIAGYLNYLNNVGVKNDVVKPKVGQYVEYDVIYDDIFASTSSATKTFGKTDGWRYLGTDDTGNHLLISTGIPMILKHSNAANNASAQWWDTTQTNVNAKMIEGLKKNLANIPYAKVTAGTRTCNDNAMIGLFDIKEGTVVDYFRVTGKTYSNSITVRTLTLAELNRAVNSANAGVEEYIQRDETSTSSGFKDIPEQNTANGLFDLSDIGLLNNYWYWLASPFTGNASYFCCVEYNNVNVRGIGGQDCALGVRPVVVLPSTVQFTDVGGDGILEIK